LHNVLLMLLRCLAILLIVIAFTRPFFSGGSAAKDNSAAGATVVLIDSSLSMRREQMFTTALQRAASAIEERKSDEMTEAGFWQIVEESARSGTDQQSQAAVLRATLDRLAPQEIEAFADIFEGLMRQSYRWDLWGAGFVVEGGMSDDGFEYFRRWLISRGTAASQLWYADISW